MNTQLGSSIVLILLSTLSGVAGQTAIKLGVSKPGGAEIATGLLALISLVFKSPLWLRGRCTK